MLYKLLDFMYALKYFLVDEAFEVQIYHWIN